MMGTRDTMVGARSVKLLELGVKVLNRIQSYTIFHYQQYR